MKEPSHKDTPSLPPPKREAPRQEATIKVLREGFLGKCRAFQAAALSLSPFTPSSGAGSFLRAGDSDSSSPAAAPTGPPEKAPAQDAPAASSTQAGTRPNEPTAAESAAFMSLVSPNYFKGWQGGGQGGDAALDKGWACPPLTFAWSERGRLTDAVLNKMRMNDNLALLFHPADCADIFHWMRREAGEGAVVLLKGDAAGGAGGDNGSGAAPAAPCWSLDLDALPPAKQAKLDARICNLVEARLGNPFLLKPPPRNTGQRGGARAPRAAAVGPALGSASADVPATGPAPGARAGAAESGAGIDGEPAELGDDGATSADASVKEEKAAKLGRKHDKRVRQRLAGDDASSSPSPERPEPAAPAAAHHALNADPALDASAAEACAPASPSPPLSGEDSEGTPADGGSAKELEPEPQPEEEEEEEEEVGEEEGATAVAPAHDIGSSSDDHSAASCPPATPRAGSPPRALRACGGIRVLRAAVPPPASPCGAVAQDLPGASPRSLASAEWQTARPKGRPSSARGARGGDAAAASSHSRGAGGGDSAGGGRKRGKRRGGRRERERLERVAAAAARRADLGGPPPAPPAARAAIAAALPPPPPVPPPPLRPRGPLNFADAVRGARALEVVEESATAAAPAQPAQPEAASPPAPAPSPTALSKRRAARACRRGRGGAASGPGAVPEAPPGPDGEAPCVSEWSARTSDAGSDFMHSSPVLASPMSVLSGERTAFAGPLLGPSRSWAAVAKDPHWPPPPPPPPRTRSAAAAAPPGAAPPASQPPVPLGVATGAPSMDASQPSTPSFVAGCAALDPAAASAGSADAPATEVYDEAEPQLPSALLAEIALDPQPLASAPGPGAGGPAAALAPGPRLGHSGSLFAEDLFACVGGRKPAMAAPASAPGPNPWANQGGGPALGAGPEDMWRLQSAAGLAGHGAPLDPLAQAHFQQPPSPAAAPPPSLLHGATGFHEAQPSAPRPGGLQAPWGPHRANRLSAAALPFVPLRHKAISPPPFWSPAPGPQPLSGAPGGYAQLPSFTHSPLGKSLGLISCGDYGQW